jgi:AAA ATPase domain
VSRRGVRRLRDHAVVLILRALNSVSLLGRDAELARIQNLLDDEGGALLLVGDAGVGKSALLAEARERAGDMCVLCCGGVESEAALPFAALHQLLRPLLDRVATLPRPQATALLRALGEEPGGAERFLVSAAVLSLLDDAAEEGPVLCLIDDAHWLDDASAEVLQFVARRLHAEGIAMLFAAREDAGLPSVPQLKLDGLGAGAAARLLDRHAELAPHVRDRLVAITAGNPLALLELSAGLSGAQRIGAEPLLGPLPVSASVERAFLLRVRRLPEDTQAMLLVAAADDSGDLATVLAAAETLQAPAAALDPAEADGLVLVDGARLQLRHPLVRSAIYHGAPLSRRRAAHAALAGALPGDAHADRRAWHRAAASAGADPAVVEELEHAARRAHSRGAYAAASLAYERAASLTSDGERQARQLTAAAGAAWPLGDVERTHSLLRRARPLTADPRLSADIARLSGMVELIQGVPATAWRSLVQAAEEVRALDPDRALALLTIASLAATYACDDAAVERIAAAASLLPARDTAVARFLTTRLRGVGAHYARDFPRGPRAARRAPDRRARR